MVYLQTNTANQTLRLSLDEARQYFATPYSHYLLVLEHEENSTTGSKLAQVPFIVSESVRITTLVVTTVGLSLSGRYRYTVYGQTSGTNLSPTDAAVVGVLEIGYAVLTDSTEFYQVPQINITNDIIYGE